MPKFVAYHPKKPHVPLMIHVPLVENHCANVVMYTELHINTDLILQLQRVTGTSSKPSKKSQKAVENDNSAASTANTVTQKLSEKEVTTLFEKMLVKLLLNCC